MPSASSNLAPSAIHSCLVQWQNGRMWTGRRRFDPSSRDQVRQAATPDMLRSSNWQRRRSQKPRAAGSNHPPGHQVHDDNGPRARWDGRGLTHLY
jgi:hypothetical protein